jgi:hypothetical protein
VNRFRGRFVDVHYSFDAGSLEDAPTKRVTGKGAAGVEPDLAGY